MSTHRRHDIATLRIDGDDVRLRYADVVVVERPETPNADWESIVVPFVDPGLEPGAYVLDLVTLEGVALRGEALLVRSVDGTIVLRGAGPLEELPIDGA